MSSNRKVREELERIYGRKCMMHEGLKIKGYRMSKSKYKGKAIMAQLTLHHIKPRCKGGQTTVENGAVLCRACHDFLEQSNPAKKQALNQALKDYKMNFKPVLGVALIEDNKVKEIKSMDLDDKEDYITIKAYNTRARRKRETQELINEYYEEER